MLKIKEGSVFDLKCDLLVLPCASNGGMTDWVYNEVQSNKLPLPGSVIPFGSALFQSTAARYANADFIAYAASVSGRIESNLEAISSILIEVIKFCTDHDCSIVNLPLLGCGAGGLTPDDVLAEYQKLLSLEAIVFNLFIPDRLLARKLLHENEAAMSSKEVVLEHPRVFISYSWKDEAVKDWVYGLAKKLCAHGVDARLDRFHLRPGMDLPQWMTNELVKAKKVLLICDAHYALKADNRRAGVGWETMIIQGDMLMQGEVNAKYLVVAFEEVEKSTPIYMKSRLAMTKAEIDANFDRLLEHIFEVETAPEIGLIPKWISQRMKV